MKNSIPESKQIQIQRKPAKSKYHWFTGVYQFVTCKKRSGEIYHGEYIKAGIEAVLRKLWSCPGVYRNRNKRFPSD